MNLLVEAKRDKLKVLKVFGRAGNEAEDSSKEERALRRLASSNVPGVPRLVEKPGTPALLLPSPLRADLPLPPRGQVPGHHPQGGPATSSRPRADPPCSSIGGAAGPIDSTERYCGSICLVLRNDGEWPEGSAYTAKDDIVAAIRTVALIRLGKERGRAVQGGGREPRQPRRDGVGLLAQRRQDRARSCCARRGSGCDRGRGGCERPVL
jgi:hypothetical protein